MSASARPHRSRPRRLYSYIPRVPRRLVQLRLLWSGCRLSHSDWGWLGVRWLGWSWVALGGSLSFYIPEAYALRLLTRARPSMVRLSSLVADASGPASSARASTSRKYALS